MKLPSAAKRPLAHPGRQRLSHCESPCGVHVGCYARTPRDRTYLRLRYETCSASHRRIDVYEAHIIQLSLLTLHHPKCSDQFVVFEQALYGLFDRLDR